MAQPLLQIRFLGGFYLSYNNTPHNGVSSARLQSLLTYLVLHADVPQSRQQVAFLLWPDASESQARNNLRQFLFQLRQVLPDPNRFLRTDGAVIHWNTDENQSIDLHLFGRALQEADTSEQRGDHTGLQKMLEQAIAVYQGDLLPGCYEDWIAPEREHLRQQCRNACKKLMRLLEARREYAAALKAGQKLIRFDPLDEELYVTLMRLHELDGDAAGARRVYQTAVETLYSELEIEPGELLRSAYERLQHGTRTPVSFSKDDPYIGASFSLVGRQPEWQTLQAVWNSASVESARFVLITGEAGIGKSRLAEELFTWATLQGFTTAYTRSYAAEGSLSFAPVVELLRSTAMRPHWRTLDRVWLTELARLVPEILTEHPDLARPEPITEYGQRQRFFEALSRAVLASPQPLLLWIDDLQWGDQETLEWLHFLLRFKPDHGLLILGTVRSEEAPTNHPLSLLVQQLQIEDKVTVIDLSALDAAEISGLASQVQGRDLDTAETIRLYHETEGNPLFIVETIRAGMIGAQMLETEGRLDPTSGESHVLAPRVYAVISRRLSQLSPSARKVAELGAAIGRAFPFDLLVRAGSEEEETVVDALNELAQRRVIREQSANIFDFTHDKLREVAYLEISLPQRRLFHRHIAKALEVTHGEDLDAVSSQLAAHCEQAGMIEQAISAYQRAGIVAAGVFANMDAIRFLKNALTLLPHISDNVKRDRQELEIQLALSILYRITQGWTSPDVENALNRALELSDQAHDRMHRLKTLFGLQLVYVVQARYEKVEHAHAQAAALLIEMLGAVPPPYTANLAIAKLYMGQAVEARRLFEEIVSTLDRDLLKDVQSSFGYDYVIHGQAVLSQALWCLGYPQAALESVMSAEQLAHEYGHPFDQAIAVAYKAMLQEWCTDADVFKTQAEAAFRLTHNHKNLYYMTWASILMNFSRACEKPEMDNLIQLRESINSFTESSAGIRLPYYFSLLARTFIEADRLNDGLEALDHALSIAEQNNEHWWDAEIHRLMGEVMLLKRTGLASIERTFHRSIEIARSQGAKSLELRTAMSLARLWQANSRAVEAKQLLVPVYEWFTEGFDTVDLRSARALIAQL